MYLIQGTDSNLQFTAPLEQFKAMYNEGAPDYFVNHGLYYPNAASYGYICTGFESTGDWEDHLHMNVDLDSREIKFSGVANENLSYVYYTPTCGYGQSPYNPYNPYIPGAMIGLDGPVVAAQQYTLSSYENSITLPSYVPVFLQSRPDTVANGVVDSFVDNVASVDRVDGLVAKHSSHSNIPSPSMAAVGDSSSQRNSFARVPEGVRANTSCGKQSVPSITSGRFPGQASLQLPRVRDSRGSNGLHGKASSCNSQLKSGFTTADMSSGLESSNRASMHKTKPQFLKGNESNNELVVKAYTRRAGNPDPQGNITIPMDQYNKSDFPVDYVNAKFFVIKSYSEDDVHKSIKYNVWSSTPNGNKKLNSAYEDARRIGAGDSRCCPIFLFFSVNASGQFCGVAEMTGPVDFQRDMDFWQQDKWSASFPVKWHVIKDVPNLNFRHIILENNENKPVTNSRDTQEIYYKKGLEMLQIFKNYLAKTSVLDDFMYYENRQQIIQEERSRCLVPLLDPPRKLQCVHDFPLIRNVNGSRSDANNLAAVGKSRVPADRESCCSVEKHTAATGQVSLDTNVINLTGVSRSCKVLADGVPNAVDELNMSSLSVHLDELELEPKCPLPADALSNSSDSGLVNVVTIGSMPVKVTGTESSSILTVGTIPLDPRALQQD